MAVTLTWKGVTGSSPTKVALSPANTLDYGSVQAGSWGTPVKCVCATVAGGNISTVKFWWRATTATGKGDMKGSDPWAHTYNKIAQAGTYVDPSTILQATFSAWSPMPYGIDPTTISPPPFTMTDTASGADTDYLYFAIQPPADAADGDWSGWSYRMSFLYSS